jgi:alpha-mannosidase
MHREAALLNAPLIAQFESAHDGQGLERNYSGREVSPDNVAATVLKQSEDGSGWVVRLYEVEGRETEVRLQLTSMGCEWKGKISPHQVTTLRVGRGEVREVDMAESK